MKNECFRKSDHVRRIPLLLLTVAAMLCCLTFTSISAKAAVSGNLLTNPGAEKGTLKGWTDSSPKKCWMIGYEGNIEGWQHPAPRSGKYYFMTGWPQGVETKNYLYQDVKVKDYIGDTLTFGAWLGGYGHTDKGGVRLDILNKSGKVIATKSSKLLEQKYGKWSKHLTVSLKIPKGAYKARAYMVGALHEGNECDAYFDDLTLIASNNKPDTGVVSKISNVAGAKAKVTVKKIGDATSYEIRYKAGNAKNWKTVSSKSNTFTVKVAKGKTVKVQARVQNSFGWGKWGSTKSLKTDKK